MSLYFPDGELSIQIVESRYHDTSCNRDKYEDKLIRDLELTELGDRRQLPNKLWWKRYTILPTIEGKKVGIFNGFTTWVFGKHIDQFLIENGRNRLPYIQITGIDGVSPADRQTDSNHWLTAS